MNWQGHSAVERSWGRTVGWKATGSKVQINRQMPCNSPTVTMEVKQPEGEASIRWGKIINWHQGQTLFLRNTTVLDLSFGA
ncbi:hypothetical protein [Bacteroides acidifaciens]|uniref:hypothetical protein n=1 Tax=Bacteroides acidifaciens TaxID=85831 RepID=UPI003F68CC3C